MESRMTAGQACVLLTLSLAFTLTQQACKRIKKVSEAVDLKEHLYNKSVYLKEVPAAEGVIQRPVVTWRGHSYVLSEPIFNNNPASAHFCKSAGGYLLEIDDKLEFDFAVDLIKTGKGRIFLISGTDAGHEGNWTFQRTGKPMPYLEWAPRQPDNGGRYGEDCLNLYIPRSTGYYQMNDLKCRGKWRNVRFICEFPFRVVNGTTTMRARRG